MQLTTEIIKLINNLMKNFLRPKKPKAMAITTLTPISEICQFVINNRLGHSDQLIMMIEIKQIVCNGKTNEINKKIVEAQRNQGNSNTNPNNKYLKFVHFLSIID